MPRLPQRVPEVARMLRWAEGGAEGEHVLVGAQRRLPPVRRIVYYAGLPSRLMNCAAPDEPERRTP